MEAVPIIGSTVGAALENFQACSPLPLMSPGKVGCGKLSWQKDFELCKMEIQQQDLVIRSC